MIFICFIDESKWEDQYLSYVFALNMGLDSGGN